MSEEIKLMPIHLSLLEEAIRHNGVAHGGTVNERGALGKLRMYDYLDENDRITQKGRQAVKDAR